MLVFRKMQIKTNVMHSVIIAVIATTTIIWIYLFKDTVQWENIRYKDIMSKINRNKVAYDSYMLLYSLQKYYIQHPSTLPYNISYPERKNPSRGQTQFIDSYLKQMRNGFFVECGAFDGEYLSNSLFLEQYRNWTGILIEPNPDIYKSLNSKHRKAYSVNACLSAKKYASIETFFMDDAPVLGKIVEARNKSKNRRGKYIFVQCFPLYSILLAVGRLEVDYFSLDVEGTELGILDTIPWDKVNIKMISIEHNKLPGGKQKLTQYMETIGYKVIREIKGAFSPDLIFLKETCSTDV